MPRSWYNIINKNKNPIKYVELSCVLFLTQCGFCSLTNTARLKESLRMASMMHKAFQQLESLVVLFVMT